MSQFQKWKKKSSNEREKKFGIGIGCELWFPIGNSDIFFEILVQFVQ